MRPPGRIVSPALRKSFYLIKLSMMSLDLSPIRPPKLSWAQIPVKKSAFVLPRNRLIVFKVVLPHPLNLLLRSKIRCLRKKLAVTRWKRFKATFAPKVNIFFRLVESALRKTSSNLFIGKNHTFVPRRQVLEVLHDTVFFCSRQNSVEIYDLVLSSLDWAVWA